MTTTQITYRKTKAGEWVAYAPYATVANVEYVTISKRDGSTKTEEIDRMGKTFVVDGVEMVYCYLVRAAKAATKFSAEPTYLSTPDCGHRNYRGNCEFCQNQIGR